MDIRGKRIVVLGGSSGIGLATAQAAARQGANVVIVSSRKDRVEAALATLPPGAEGHVADLADENAIRALFDRLGQFDHLVFTAGENLQIGSLAATDLDAARRFFATRYWGAFCAAKYGIGKIRTGGSIVFTSGIAGQRPHAGLTRALAVELAPIRVNIVSPGVVKTALWGNVSEAERAALYKDTAERSLTGHVADADEIAQAYLYLMRQGYSTGQVLVVDGGAVLV
jgi:NAD(P)-dependent dehydrogenase (short-subunit alcohol dehydrogenase family)